MKRQWAYVGVSFVEVSSKGSEAEESRSHCNSNLTEWHCVFCVLQISWHFWKFFSKPRFQSLFDPLVKIFPDDDAVLVPFHGCCQQHINGEKRRNFFFGRKTDFWVCNFQIWPPAASKKLISPNLVHLWLQLVHSSAVRLELVLHEKIPHIFPPRWCFWKKVKYGSLIFDFQIMQCKALEAFWSSFFPKLHFGQRFSLWKFRLMLPNSRPSQKVSVDSFLW